MYFISFFLFCSDAGASPGLSCAQCEHRRSRISHFFSDGETTRKIKTKNQRCDAAGRKLIGRFDFIPLPANLIPFAARRRGAHLKKAPTRLRFSRNAFRFRSRSVQAKATKSQPHGAFEPVDYRLPGSHTGGYWPASASPRLRMFSVCVRKRGPWGTAGLPRSSQRCTGT